MNSKKLIKFLNELIETVSQRENFISFVITFRPLEKFISRDYEFQVYLHARGHLFEDSTKWCTLENISFCNIIYMDMRKWNRCRCVLNMSKKSLIKHIKQSKYENQEKRTQKDKSEELLKLNKLCTW